MWNEMLPMMRAVFKVQVNGESRRVCALDRTAEKADA